MEAVFWFVWCKERDQPRYEHTTLVSAVAEAERLARANPGHRFIVLQAVTAREVNNLQRIDYDSIPF